MSARRLHLGEDIATLLDVAVARRLLPGDLQVALLLGALREARATPRVAVSIRRVAAALRISPSGAAYRLARLRSAGLLAAYPDPEHRRPTEYDLAPLDRALAETRRAHR